MVTPLNHWVTIKFKDLPKGIIPHSKEGRYANFLRTFHQKQNTSFFTYILCEKQLLFHYYQEKFHNTLSLIKI